MKNAFYLFVLVLTMFASCKKDQTPKPNPGPDPEPAPAKMIQKYVNGDDYIEFAYTEDNIISTVTVKNDIATAGEETDFTVAYNEDGTIKELEGSNGQTIVPVYENGLLSRADIIQEGIRIGQTAYYYENQKLSFATIYLLEEQDFLPVLEFRFSHNAAGNIIETVLMMADETPNHMVRAGSVKMEYDTHENPLYKHNDLLMLFWQLASKNNVTTETHINAELQAENKYVYTYTYMDNGLPQSAEVKVGLPGTPQTTEHVNFIYK